VELLVKQGLDLLINISGSPFYVGKRDLRINILTNLARKYHLPVVYVNLVGGNDSLLFDGGSMVIDPQGEIRASAKEFEEDLITFDVETNQGDLHLSISTDEELIFKALCLGTRDYVAKCGFKHVALGLSGGIDSSLVACIAAQALGKENVLGVLMPSPYSLRRQVWRMRSFALPGINFSQHLHIRYISNIPQRVAAFFAQYESDTTEENLQARIRGNPPALANKFNALVLMTGNKSEMAVGYCTLYGDMCGALAVISDVPKTMVYNLARYLNRREELIPARVITRPPSAELKPDQTDQDTLPPYDVLDDILTEYVEKNRSIADIIKKGHDPRIVQDIIRRIHLNEYKRKQAPPGLKITTKAFGVGRRYPIAHRFIVIMIVIY
jgi:NAD+ synthetase